MSDSVRPQRWQPPRLPRPWDSPGKNTGVACHFLLQCMKVKSESEVAQSCPTLSDPMDCSLPGSSVHGIFQARVLEWGAIAFSIIFLIMLFRPEFKALAWSPKFVLCAVSQCSPKYPVFWQKQSTCSSLNILSSLLSLCFYFLPRLFPHPHIFLSNT